MALVKTAKYQVGPAAMATKPSGSGFGGIPVGGVDLRQIVDICFEKLCCKGEQKYGWCLVGDSGQEN